MSTEETITVKSGKSIQPAATLHARPARSIRLMQDVVRRPQPTPAAAPTNSVILPKQRDNPIASLPLKHHQPQHPKTLMRNVVTKPAPGLKRQLSMSVPAAKNTDVSVMVRPKQSVAQIDPKRNSRSQGVPKSQFIQKFAPEKRTWFTGHEHAAVKIAKPTTSAQEVAAPPRQSMDIFQKAFERANSHQPTTDIEEAKTNQLKSARRRAKPVHHRLPTILAVSLAVVVLAGIIAYQFRPAITLRFANAKAGFHTVMPNWTPSGFGVANFQYEPGSVSVNYARSGTSRHYTFSQSSSKLNSQTLLDTTVAPADHAYQTLQNGGRTIYIYGNNNAAWVDSGRLYKITSDGNLSTSDILSIATSV